MSAETNLSHRDKESANLRPEYRGPKGQKGEDDATASAPSKKGECGVEGLPEVAVHFQRYQYAFPNQEGAWLRHAPPVPGYHVIVT